MVDEPDGEKRRAWRTTADHEAAMKRVRLDIERARQEFEERLDRLRIELEAAKGEFHRAVRRIARLDAPRTPDGLASVWPKTLRGRWHPRPPRPWRGLDGGEPMPVEPKPKPKPLIDGAEAPVD